MAVPWLRPLTALFPKGVVASDAETLTAHSGDAWFATTLPQAVVFPRRAEEVAKVYPELVVRDEKGRIDGVRYDELAPMLLNEVQKQAAEIRALKLQAQTVGEMQKQLEEMHAALVKLQSKDELVARR